MKEYIKNTIDVYSSLGKKYLKDIAQATPDEIKLFMQRLPQRASVLEIGCAGGRDSKVFSDNNFQVTGIDLCDNFLIEARREIPDGTFINMDVLNLDFEPSTFDAVWAMAVLLHLKKSDIPQALNGIKRVLKTGGILFVGVKIGKGEVLHQDKLSGENERFFSFFSKNEIEQYVKDAGFKITYSKVRSDDVGRQDLKWVRLIAKKIG